jgi:hypothetical protein
VSPSTSVPYGAILSQPAVQGDQRVLDLVGVRYVVALNGEPVAPGLTRRATLSSTNGTTFVLWGNPSAAPGAVVVDAGAKTLSLSPLQGCDARALLCRDFTPLHALVRPDRVSVSREEGRIVLSLDAAGSSRVVLLWDLFRPEWTTATAGASIAPALGGLMFVEVPPGATDVVLTYRPLVRLGLSLLAWVALAGVVCALLADALSKRRHIEGPGVLA